MPEHQDIPQDLPIDEHSTPCFTPPATDMRSEYQPFEKKSSTEDDR